MESQRTDSPTRAGQRGRSPYDPDDEPFRPTRLLCYCGKPLDKLDAQGQPAGQRGRQVHGGPPPRSSRYSAYVPGPDRQPRFTFHCRRCRATVTVRDLTLFDAHRKARPEGRDVVAGVDF